MSKDLRIGQAIKYNEPNGSYGRIVYCHPPTAEERCVQWNYGKDYKGDSITAQSCHVRTGALVSVREEFYAQYVSILAWSEAQKELERSYLEVVKGPQAFEERDEARWRADRAEFDRDRFSAHAALELETALTEAHAALERSIAECEHLRKEIEDSKETWTTRAYKRVSERLREEQTNGKCFCGRVACLEHKL